MKSKFPVNRNHNNFLTQLKMYIKDVEVYTTITLMYIPKLGSSQPSFLLYSVNVGSPMVNFFLEISDKFLSIT